MLIITSTIDNVFDKSKTPCITGKEDFIAIGELHNSRSAIKFIIDHINQLISSDPKRKTYLLTECFPTGLSLNSGEIPKSESGTKLSHTETIEYLKSRKNIWFDIESREKDKGSVSDDSYPYTLQSLYSIALGKDIEIHSIEKQDGSSAELMRGIKAGDLSALEKRTNDVNELALEKAQAIWANDPNAKILVFAGMGHTASKEIKKFSTKPMLSILLSGIGDLLKKEVTRSGVKRTGIIVHVHDLALCMNEQALGEISYTKNCYSRCIDTERFDDYTLLPMSVLKKFKIREKTIYIEIQKNIIDGVILNYKVQLNSKKEAAGTIKIKEDLPGCSIKEGDTIESLKAFLPNILGITSQNKHTPPEFVNVAVDNPDLLLFLPTPVSENVNRPLLTNDYDSIFLPGSCDFDTMQKAAKSPPVVPGGSSIAENSAALFQQVKGSDVGKNNVFLAKPKH